MATTSSGAVLRVRLAVSLAQLLCGVGGVVGSGVRGPGTSVRDFAGGAFRPDATLIAPAGPAFSIWSLIYLGLAVYTLLIWMPGSLSARVVRRTGWWAAASMALNGLWIFVARAEQVVLGAVVLLTLTLCLGRVCQALIETTLSSATRILLEGTFGLFLGWSSVATVGNVATALVRHGAPATGAVATAAKVIVLAAFAGLGIWFAYRLPKQLGVLFGLVWGLAWLAVQRTAGEPTSLVVALAAGAAAAVIAGAFATTAPRRQLIFPSGVRPSTNRPTPSTGR